MGHIEFETATLHAETDLFTKPAQARVITNFIYGEEKELAIVSSDEIPFFFSYEGRLLGGMKIDKEATLSGELKRHMESFLQSEHADPKKLDCYLGPALTFSHNPAERSLQEQLIQKGYRAVCKRGHGVDYVDLPLLNALYLRELGIPMENIEISEYGTYEIPYLASQSAGKEGENITVVRLK